MSDLFSPRTDLPSPRGLQAFGMGLFLAALSMLFGGGWLIYMLLRLKAAQVDPATATAELPKGSLSFPWLMFVSTPLMFFASAWLHGALAQVRLEHQPLFMRRLSLAMIFSVLFCVIQAPAVWQLLAHHADAVAGLKTDLGDAVEGGGKVGEGHAFYAVVASLLVLHALHVIGGVVPLAVVWRKARQGAYDHEAHQPVRVLVWYWHFLDVVWIVLFCTFLFTR